MLLIILIVLIIIIYVLSYTKVDSSYEIIQVFLRNCTPDIFKEKHPIVISDQLPDIKSLLTTLFAYLYCFSYSELSLSTNTQINKSKFLLLQNKNLDTLAINLISPKFADHKDISTVKLVTVKLKQNQVILLPVKWMYQCDSTVLKVSLDDPISKIISFCIRNPLIGTV